jgi:hypothetical protein
MFQIGKALTNFALSQPSLPPIVRAFELRKEAPKAFDSVENNIKRRLPPPLSRQFAEVVRS